MAIPRATTHARLLCGAAAAAMLCFSGAAQAQDQAPITIAPQSLATALYEFGGQTGRQVLFTPDVAAAKMTRGVSGATDQQAALAQLLEGTGLTYRTTGETYLIVQAREGGSDPQSASAAGDGADGTVEALIVTAQKREEDIQDVPIAISAFTQEDLTRSQVAGGPDLMTQVPNFTFTKTNFSGYSIQIRGIGTQAISATVDPAVAVAFNNTPFIRNRFFEQEFYDLQRVEVLRGPQGTLYGRNATAGVVNIISAKPSFSPDAKVSADVGNFRSTRLEGMLNIPLVEDKAALRIAGAWTKRDGYVTNEITGSPIDGRDLWSSRVSLRLEPNERISANLIWEHFEEDDDRLRSGKQLCKRANVTEVNGIALSPDDGYSGHAGGVQTMLSQGCLPASLYSPDAFEVPNGFMLPYYAPLTQIGFPAPLNFDPYTNATQSHDLRVIESTMDPQYRAMSDLGELQLSFQLSDALTLYSETGYSRDELFAAQDFNRFNTRPGAFDHATFSVREGALDENKVFCDPQLGCADRLVLGDLSTAKSTQFSQEFRLASDLGGPVDFSLGANFVRYDTEDKYYIFANSLTLWAATNWSANALGPYVAGVSDNMECMGNLRPPPDGSTGSVTECIYIDPNPMTSLNDMGHNYFLSRNPYKLISYAAFGEIYYDVLENLRITAGLRWTVDKKEAPRIPSQLIMGGSFGYPVLETVSQEWREPTGRLTVDWKPDLSFTDETLIYASYAHGYKAGGMNPPPAMLSLYQTIVGLQESLIQPKTFDPEFVDAFEIGTKNTLLDGQLTLNATAFYYDYEGYQLSRIVNRSAVTDNYDATIWGLELEVDWRPLENLRLGLKQGYESTRVADHHWAIDLMDRTAGKEGWVVMRPFPTIPSSCVVPAWILTWGGQVNNPVANSYGSDGLCAMAYMQNVDPITGLPYVPDPEIFGPPGNFIGPYVGTGYPGWDPTIDYGNNNGEGFLKPLGGNELPNAPDFTTTVTVDYTLPLPNDWLMTLHADLYRQSEAWTRIFNMEGYDKLKAYTNVNLAAIFTNEDAGWNVMAYVKNVLDADNITGAFLNSDDTGLTTNVFLNEPRLYGVRVTKQWNGVGLLGGGGDARSGPRPFTLEIAGGPQRQDASNGVFTPGFASDFEDPTLPLGLQNGDMDWGDYRHARLSYRPGNGRWSISLAYSYARNNRFNRNYDEAAIDPFCIFGDQFCVPDDLPNFMKYNYATGTGFASERHELTDFAVGREVGLGVLADEHGAEVSLGLRYAAFESSSEFELSGVPDYYFPARDASAWPLIHHRYALDFGAERRFRGLGPRLALDASKVLFGNDDAGRVALDWGVSGGVLFGRQRVSHKRVQTTDLAEGLFGAYVTTTVTPGGGERSKSVTVPNLAASLGLSYEIDRVKVGAGYRIERFFDVIDGGWDRRETFDRTDQGPYFKIAVGFGG